MKHFTVFLLAASGLCSGALVRAQGAGQTQPLPQQQEAQRRAELRRVLQQKQTGEIAQRQLNAQERADLRQALRQQRAGEAASAAAHVGAVHQAGVTKP